MSSNSSPRQRALTIGLILLGVVVTFFFGMRALHAFKRFNGHHPPPPGKIETDVELIRDWMTIPFIGKMYHVPGKIIFDELDIPENGNLEKSLKELNDEYYPNEDGFVIETVKQIVLAHLPPPTPDSAPDAPIAP